MSIDVDVAWDAVGAAVSTVTGLRVHTYAVDQIQPPAAVVLLESVDYDYTHGRGTDRAVFKVFVCVSRAYDRVARENLSPYLSGAGAATTAIKAAVDALGPAAACTRVDVQTVTVAGAEYVAGVFDVDYVA